jgi:transcriptional regulator with XRE-family HTH domain
VTKRIFRLKSLDKALGARLKLLRKSKGYETQEDFAVALNTDRANVARWEAGIFRPSQPMSDKILEVLDIKEKDLWPINTGSIPPDIAEAIASASEIDIELIRRVLKLPDPDIVQPRERKSQS